MNTHLILKCHPTCVQNLIGKETVFFLRLRLTRLKRPALTTQLVVPLWFLQPTQLRAQSKNQKKQTLKRPQQQTLAAQQPQLPGHLCQKTRHRKQLP
jgi:hypothetical protein